MDQELQSAFGEVFRRIERSDREHRDAMSRSDGKSDSQFRTLQALIQEHLRESAKLNENHCLKIEAAHRRLDEHDTRHDLLLRKIEADKEQADSEARANRRSLLMWGLGIIGSVIALGAKAVWDWMVGRGGRP